uniref:Uncharacterized protein n=1 Tax=Arundo donax TaxID=35708 RepID=A0A0A9FXG6_ARUDO
MIEDISARVQQNYSQPEIHLLWPGFEMDSNQKIQLKMRKEIPI